MPATARPVRAVSFRRHAPPPDQRSGATNSHPGFCRWWVPTVGRHDSSDCRKPIGAVRHQGRAPLLLLHNRRLASRAALLVHSRFPAGCLRRTHCHPRRAAWRGIAGHPADEHGGFRRAAGPVLHRHRSALAGYRPLGRCLRLRVRAGQVLHLVLVAVRCRLRGDGAARRGRPAQFHRLLPAPQPGVAGHWPGPCAAAVVRRHPGQLRVAVVAVAGLSRGAAGLVAGAGRDQLPDCRCIDAAVGAGGGTGCGRRGQCGQGTGNGMAGH